jgi:hypothetical protein
VTEQFAAVLAAVRLLSRVAAQVAAQVPHAVEGLPAQRAVVGLVRSPAAPPSAGAPRRSPPGRRAPGGQLLGTLELEGVDEGAVALQAFQPLPCLTVPTISGKHFSLNDDRNQTLAYVIVSAPPPTLFVCGFYFLLTPLDLESI